MSLAGIPGSLMMVLKDFLPFFNPTLSPRNLGNITQHYNTQAGTDVVYCARPSHQYFCSLLRVVKTQKANDYYFFMFWLEKTN